MRISYRTPVAALTVVLATAALVAIPVMTAASADATDVTVPVTVWGANPDYALGNPAPENGSLTLPSGVAVTQLSAADNYAVALLSNGTCRGWGDDYFTVTQPQLGSSAAAVVKPATPSTRGAISSGVLRELGGNPAAEAPNPCRDASQIAVATQFLLTLKRDGTVSTVGDWVYLGGATAFQNWANGLRDVTEIRTTDSVAVALRRDGTVSVSPSASGSGGPTCQWPAGTKYSHVDVGTDSQNTFVVASSGSTVTQCGLNGPSSQPFSAPVTQLSAGYGFAAVVQADSTPGFFVPGASAPAPQFAAGTSCFDIAAGGFPSGTPDGDVLFAYCLTSRGTIVTASTGTAAPTAPTDAKVSLIASNSYGGFALASPAGAPTPLVNRGDSVARNSAQCLDPSATVTACAAPTPQQFAPILTPVAGAVLLRSGTAGTCLSRDTTNAVTLATCDIAAAAQQWREIPATDSGYVVIRADDGADLCLSPTGADRRVAAVSCTQADLHQQWGFDLNSTNKAGSRTTLVSSSNPVARGTQVTLTATVTVSNSPAASGLVRFSWTGRSATGSDYQPSSTEVSVANGSATYTFDTATAVAGSLPLDTSEITAAYAGNAYVTDSSASIDQTVDYLPEAVFTASDGNIVGIDPTTMAERGRTPASGQSLGDVVAGLGDGRTVVQLDAPRLRVWSRNSTNPWTLTEQASRTIVVPGLQPGQGSVQFLGKSVVVVTGPGLAVPAFVDVAIGTVWTSPWTIPDLQVDASIRARVTADQHVWFSVHVAGMGAGDNRLVSGLLQTINGSLQVVGLSVVATGSTLLNVAGNGSVFFRGSAAGVVSSQNPSAPVNQDNVLALAQPQAAGDDTVIWASSLGASAGRTITAYRAQGSALTTLANTSAGDVVVYSVCTDPGAPTTAAFGASEYRDAFYRLAYVDGRIDVRSLSLARPQGCAVLKGIGS